jgi:hypothetical protein
MPKIAKILLLDREFENISEEDYEKLLDEYALYAVGLFKFVQGLRGIASKEAKDTIYGSLLSPFQYFLEDRIRLKRLDRGVLKNPWKR